jgi:hypothetical protein
MVLSGMKVSGGKKPFEMSGGWMSAGGWMTAGGA